jgi:hypothetical protein
MKDAGLDLFPFWEFKTFVVCGLLFVVCILEG